MATNKNAIIRYRVLDRCFRNHYKKFFWQDLQEACNKELIEHNKSDNGVSRRQIYEDINFMESEAGYTAEIERLKDGQRKYYRYADPSFSINHLPLNETELHQLQEAVYTLSRFEGLPQFGWIQELLPRLQQNALVEPLKPVIAYEENRYLKGIHHIPVLFNAIINKQVLRICYKEFKSEASEQLIYHPYFLKEYNNRWFILGHNEKEKNDFWILALDRFISVESIKKKYLRNTSIDWEEHFKDLIGVTKKPGRKVTTIQLWFHPDSAPYVLTKKFHSSQETISNCSKEGLHIKIKLIPNYEFYQSVLFYGDRVKIVSPLGIAHKFKRVLERALAHYG